MWLLYYISPTVKSSIAYSDTLPYRPNSRVFRFSRDFLILACELSETIIASAALDFPFPTEPDDHCESPREAYTHILPLLSKLAGKDASKLRIYDPYFCDGAVKQNLGELGFPNVHNQKEDCYEVWSNPKDYPTHDLVVTNPPYSGDHMAKLFEHVTSKQFGNRPWFLLLPNFVSF